MHDVQGAPRLLRKKEGAGYGLCFSVNRPGIQVVADGCAPGRTCHLGARLRHSIVLRVDGNRQAETRGDAHAAVEGLIVTGAKIADAARGHEGFEPHHAALGKLFEVVEVVRREPTPQGKIRPGQGPGSGELLLE